MASGVIGDPIETLIAGTGGKGMKMMVGAAAFVTTAATLTIPVKMHVVLAVIVVSAGAMAAGENPYWSDTRNASAQFVVGATGVVTITRPVTTTSGLKVNYIIVGF